MTFENPFNNAPSSKHELVGKYDKESVKIKLSRLFGESNQFDLALNQTGLTFEQVSPMLDSLPDEDFEDIGRNISRIISDIRLNQDTDTDSQEDFALLAGYLHSL